MLLHSARLLAIPCTWVALASPARAQESLTDRYRDVADRILAAAREDTDGWDKLVHLTTHVGNRLSGSEGLEKAIAWALPTMQAEGLAARLQPVQVPHWVRGAESAEVVEPVQRPLAMLGLGGSVGTPPEGITAPVVVVTSFDELDALEPEQVEGRIVVYAVEWQGYGRTVAYRTNGAARAAARGAVAALVRSATGRSLYTPHTGAMRYADDVPKVPGAAITVEDAMWLLQRQRDGEETTVHLTMEARTLEDAPSANVIAEIPGRELPEEVVVMGGHFDSWDVGQGAHDDGASCIAAWHALTLLHRLDLQPRRTLRVVLWTNEENGLAGGNAYRDALGDDVGSHVAAIEMDGGCERPTGFGFSLPGGANEGDDAYDRAHAMLDQIAALLEPLDATHIERGGGGADIGPLMRAGVPGMSLETVGEHYFDWHHTNADTVDKVEPESLRNATAMLAIMGYALADMPDTLASR